MVLFNLKHWKTQILSKGSTLNYRRPPTNLLVKQPKTALPGLHATYPMTLNFQTCLKEILKIFYLASISVKPLNEPNTSKITEGIGSGIGFSFEKYNRFSNKIINLPRGV